MVVKMANLIYQKKSATWITLTYRHRQAPTRITRQAAPMGCVGIVFWLGLEELTVS
jgi:hypothetical protein